MQSIPATMVETDPIYGLLKKSRLNALKRITGKRAISAPAGAGTPVKNLLDKGVLIFSISCVLKRASLKHMQTQKNIAIIHPNLSMFCIEKRYIARAGHTPKTTKSERESSSAPNLLHELSILAKRPSVISRKAAPSVERTTYCHSPFMEKRICAKPTRSADKVAKLGTIFPNESSLKIFFLFFRAIFSTRLIT